MSLRRLDMAVLECLPASHRDTQSRSIHGGRLNLVVMEIATHVSRVGVGFLSYLKIRDAENFRLD
jgi:hypothetical protein